MTKDERITNYKFSVLQHARKHKNITYTFKAFQISRTIYYDWLKRFIKLGYPGLQDKKKAKPKMPNQIKADKEQIILNYIIAYPTHGPRRIANELRQQKMTISETGIYHVLRRKQLNHRLFRLFYAQEKSNNPIVTGKIPKGSRKEKTGTYSCLLSRISLLSGYLLCRYH